MLFGLGWLALAFVAMRLVGGAAKLGGPGDPRRGTDKPKWKCLQCDWAGDYGEAAFKIFVDDLEPYCPECGWFLDTGP